MWLGFELSVELELSLPTVFLASESSSSTLISVHKQITPSGSMASLTTYMHHICVCDSVCNYSNFCIQILANVTPVHLSLNKALLCP